MTLLASSRPARRRATLAAVAIVSFALLAGCTSAAPEATPSATVGTPTPIPTPTPTPTPTPESVFAPLTGAEVTTAIDTPALSAKIDNHWDARPQWGLEHTDIVFEELVEGGLTRYVAVWHSDVPDEVGPVRSIRPMDPDIVSPLGGIIAYSGGQARFVRMMRNTELHNAIHGGADDRFMYRATSKRAPHNVVLKAQDIVAAYDDLDAPPAQFHYSDEGRAPAFGTPSAGIDVRFSPESPRSWTWDAASGTYLRAQDGRKDVDAGGTQLSAVNVVVLSVPIDWSYGIIPRTVMVGEGKAWISTGGSVMTATWSKDSRTDRITLRNAAGRLVKLAPGNTWVELVPTSGSVTVRG